MTAVTEIYPLTALPMKLQKRITKRPSPTGRHFALIAAGRDPSSDCWIFDSTSSDGYAQLKWRNKVWNGHRLTYHLLVSPLHQPGKARQLDGRVVDHICEVRACVSPNHLELISQSDNTKRGARHRAD